VEMVNGQPISGPSDIMEIGKKLSKTRPGHKVRVNIRRGSEDLILTYLLVK
jgi:S1-C subfamily serine protease